MTLEQKPNFKLQQKTLEAYNLQHQRSNPLLKQARLFLERRKNGSINSNLHNK